MELAPIDQVIKLAHKMGIVSDLPNVLSLALGVGEVSPLEMTNAFGVFANEGIWVEPISILRIEDRNGNVLEDNMPESHESISEGVAYIMADMMIKHIDKKRIALGIDKTRERVLMDMADRQKLEAT
jgi:penicillin-binding protein 1A